MYLTNHTQTIQQWPCLRIAKEPQIVVKISLGILKLIRFIQRITNLQIDFWIELKPIFSF